MDNDKEPWEVYQDDIHALLEALGLGTHARPEPPHEVLHSEIIPKINDLTMSYDGVASGSAYKNFTTITSESDIDVRLEEAGDLEITIGNARGYATRKAALILARRLMDVAMQPERRAMRHPMTPRQHREHHGLTQEEAAERVGITRSYLGKIERGEGKEVSLRVIRRLAALYECSTEDLGVHLSAEE